MKSIKRILVIAIVAMGLTSCEETIFPNKIKDEPRIEMAKSITLVAEGDSEVIIEVRSTGIDDATIRLIDNYEIDEESGDLIALEPWAEIVKVVDNYQDGATRALACWDSAIVVRVKPNYSGKERKAVLSVRSFNIRASIELVQSAE